ncbi:MAG: MATE family efflux transporter [Deltaproteobacteria bacterium]|nr:MAG: MATE family efflux transporter [Deltaproteobacteria bacterium]
MKAPASAVAPDDRWTTLVAVVLRLSWPAVLASLVQTLVFLADRVMLGRYDPLALGSMQVQGPVLWSVFSVFFAGLVGTVSLVSQAVGAGALARAGRVARIALGAGAGIGVAVGVGITAAAAPVARFFGPDDAALVELSTTYLRISGPGMFGLFVASTAAMILQGTGDTRSPLVAGLVANTLNVALNAVLIFGMATPVGEVPALGVAGAATGTTVAFLLEAAILVAMLRSKDGLLSQPAPDPCDLSDREILERLGRLAGPAVLDRLAVHVGFLEFVRVISSLGATAMAANQALITLESICFLTADGFAVAAAASMGQHLGAERVEGARRGTFVAVGTACATLTVFGIALWWTGTRLVTGFVASDVDAAPLLALAEQCLPILAIAQPVMAFAVVLAQALRGAGDTRTPFVAAAAGSLLVRVGAAHGLALGLGWGLRGIWWASTADWAVRSAVLAAAFAAGSWRRGVR